MNQPNILLVFTDQQRADTISALENNFNVNTPGMNRLAEHGLSFSRAYCTSPVCCPSRATLMTGLYPSQTNLFANMRGGPGGCGPLNEGLPTLAKMLHTVGYETVYHGKSHLGGSLGNHGFDIHFENSHDPSTLTEACRYYRNKDWIVNQRPFFHVVSFLDPHDIYFLEPGGKAEPTLPKWASQDDTLENKPWPQRLKHNPDIWTDEKWEYYRQFYKQRVERVDGFIRELLDELTCGGYAPNTWVIFTSDHGDMAGEHAIPFKGSYMYEGVTRIPLIIQPPRHDVLGSDTPNVGGAASMRGQQTDTLVSNVDLAATILDIAGIPSNPDLPGQSLKPLLDGGDYTPRDAVFSEWHELGTLVTPIRMVRTAEYKYNLYNEIGEELYDMVNDPHEMKNLADDPAYAEIKAKLRAMLDEHIESINDPFYSRKPSPKPDSIT